MSYGLPQNFASNSLINRTTQKSFEVSNQPSKKLRIKQQQTDWVALMKESQWKRNYNTTDLIRQIGSPIVSAKWDILQVRELYFLKRACNIHVKLWSITNVICRICENNYPPVIALAIQVDRYNNEAPRKCFVNYNYWNLTFNVQENNQCCGINGAQDWLNSDFDKIPSECCFEVNRYWRMEVSSTNRDVNRTYCKKEGTSYPKSVTSNYKKLHDTASWYNFLLLWCFRKDASNYIIHSLSTVRKGLTYGKFCKLKLACWLNDLSVMVTFGVRW